MFSTPKKIKEYNSFLAFNKTKETITSTKLDTSYGNKEHKEAKSIYLINNGTKTGKIK